MLSDKGIRILKVLVLNNKSPITAKMLGVCLDMSERSVNTYLKEVNEFCVKQQIAYDSKRGIGVCLNLSDDEIERLETLGDSSYYSAEYRIEYIKQILLEGWENYTLSLLSEELYTSRYVLGGDLELVESWFAQFNITLERKNKKGLYLDGGEINWRSAIVSFAHSKKNNDLRECHHGYDWRLGDDNTRRLELCYGEELLGKICRAIGTYEKEICASFVDYSFIMLIEYLCVQYQRVRRGNMIAEHEIRCTFLVGEEAKRVQLFGDILEEVISVNYSRGEWEYVYILLSGAEYQQSGNGDLEDNHMFSWQQVKKISGSMLAYLTDITGIHLCGDLVLCCGMESFLYHCLVRTRYQLEIINPFLEDIKKSYGAIFTTCVSLGSYIREEAGMLPSSDEIACLTLLIGGAFVRMEKKTSAVLIGAGNLLLADMTARKIEQKIPGLYVVSVLSIDSIENIKQLEYDLAITTIPGYQWDIPAVYVTPVVHDRDIVRIQKAVNQLYTAKLGLVEHISLRKYLKPELILLDIESMTKEKLIEMGCIVLEKENYVTCSYLKEVLHREMISSTEVGNGVAIPHGIENNVSRPAVLMIRLKHKIDWGSELVDIIFILALNFNDIGVTRKFFRLFYEKAGNADTVELLRNVKTRTEVLDILG